MANLLTDVQVSKSHESESGSGKRHTKASTSDLSWIYVLGFQLQYISI